MSVFAVIAYLYSKTPTFRPLITGSFRTKDYVFLYIFFSALTIMGTYLGIPIKDAIANTRAIGAVMAGLLGGPLLGGAVGLTGGLHRYMLGGFTAASCGVSTTVEGLIGGFVHMYLIRRNESHKVFSFKVAFFTTFISEITQMSLIMLISRPVTEAWDLVRVIALPMIFANSLGAALFISILKDQKNMIDVYGVTFSKKALNIANKTLGLLSKGVKSDTAEKLAKVIHEETGVGSVAITDTEKVIAFIGMGADHHKPGTVISSQCTLRSIRNNEVVFIDGISEKYECSIDEHCPLGSVLVVPLNVDGEIIGTIKMMEPKNRRFLGINKSFGKGIAELLSTQLLLSKYEEQKNLLVKSELKLVQAQVNPHFLFNTLNTIGSVIRTNPEKARELIIHLSSFFRSNLKRTSDISTLREEVEHIKSYLIIEEARFNDRLRVDIQIPEEFMNIRIPAFSLQPVVENAVKHGISSLMGEGVISISAKVGDGKCTITIEDNAGAYCMDKKSKTGIGMKSVDRRIKNLCGNQYGIDTECSEGEYTRVMIVIPEEGCGDEV
nr:sensor histidine kinase [Limisalsivibrio acetivorans]